jgi:hypothetical protein
MFNSLAFEALRGKMNNPTASIAKKASTTRRSLKML